MKGKVLDFSLQTNTGVISGADGNRYEFSGADWKDAKSPVTGMAVDFDVADGRATGVYLDPVAGDSREKKRFIAGLLSIFLGWMGIHKFYLGYSVPGVIQLAVGLGGLFLCGIPTKIAAVVGIIEGIIYLTKSDEAFHQTYVVNKKQWF